MRDFAWGGRTMKQNEHLTPPNTSPFPAPPARPRRYSTSRVLAVLVKLFSTHSVSAVSCSSVPSFIW